MDHLHAITSKCSALTLYSLLLCLSDETARITQVLLHYRPTRMLSYNAALKKKSIKSLAQLRTEGANKYTLLGNRRDFNLKIPKPFLSILVLSQIEKSNFPALLQTKQCKKLFSQDSAVNAQSLHILAIQKATPADPLGSPPPYKMLMFLVTDTTLNLEGKWQEMCKIS